jgi:transposase, IS5 family
LEDTVDIGTAVQGKNTTYPTGGKLAIKTISRLNTLAKAYGIQQRRTYGQEVKGLRLSLRHFRHAKRRGKAQKALKRLRTIAHALIRELRRSLPKAALFERYRKDALFYERVLGHRPQDPDKLYPWHEPQVYCIAKGKGHKACGQGNKASFAVTAKSNVIAGVVSHGHDVFDGHALPGILKHTAASRGKEVKAAACDRGYRGGKTVGNAQITLPPATQA